MSEIAVWCTLCGVHLTSEELEAHGESSCPRCGYDGVPCSPDEDVSVDINWHEMRILTLWAMNYANERYVKGRGVLTAICQRLQKQYPDMTPLTFAGEIKQVRELSGVSNVEVHGMPDFDEFVEVYGPGAVKEKREEPPAC